MANRVLQTTVPVVSNARHVRIRQDRINRLAEKWLSQNINMPLWPEDVYLANLNESDRLNYFFIVDALNFCFWPDKNEKRWEVEYQGRWYRGAFGLTMALKKAYENNIPISDFRYLKDIAMGELESIFSGKGKLPLLPQRLNILHDSAERMLRQYNGQVKNLVISANNSALALVYKLADEFPSFSDWAIYNDGQIWFLKRAQLLAADIWGSFRGESLGRFDDIDELTALADYRVPQVLEYFGILQYSSGLRAKIQNKELLPAGSLEEIEIRAVMIWALEWLREALSCKKKLNAIQVDRLLWMLGQELKKKPDLLPHHRTRTIYY